MGKNKLTKTIAKYLLCRQKCTIFALETNKNDDGETNRIKPHTVVSAEAVCPKWIRKKPEWTEKSAGRILPKEIKQET